MSDLSQLPHEHWCDLSSHVDCCPGRTRECTCLTGEVAKVFEAQVEHWREMYEIERRYRCLGGTPLESGAEGAAR